MDIQNSGIKAKGSVFHSAVFAVWTIFSVLLYGLMTIFLSLFSKNTARLLAQLWNTHLLAVGGIKLRIEGKEKISGDERYVFIANHQSALDIPALYSGLHHSISFIAKKELFMIPVFGWGLLAVGHTWIDRKNARKAHKSIQRAIDTLRKQNVSLILFPEGTRSSDGKLGEFKTASFSLALKAGVRIVPVSIINSSKRLPKSSSRIVPGEIIIRISDPIEPDSIKNMSKKEVSSTVRSIIQKNMAEQATSVNMV